MQDIIPEDKQPELLGTISKGNITMRVLRDVFESFMNMGPLSQVGCERGGGQCVGAWGHSARWESGTGVGVLGGSGVVRLMQGWKPTGVVFESFMNTGPLSLVGV